MTITTATDGAEIRYTTDGTAPTATSGNLYSGPIQVSATTTIAAIAYKTGWVDSPVAHATFTVTIPVASTGQAPAVTPAPTAPVPLTDAEVSEARNALARAKEVDADYYDPDNFDTARQLLDEGIDLRARDPAAARARLSSSKEKADLAFANSVSRAGQDMAARMEAARKRAAGDRGGQVPAGGVPGRHRRHRPGGGSSLNPKITPGRAHVRTRRSRT